MNITELPGEVIIAEHLDSVSLARFHRCCKHIYLATYTAIVKRKDFRKDLATKRVSDIYENFMNRVFKKKLY